ncbi:hypothetical protein ACWEOE_33165 [Amycolatopsis sp. NPDC004368]
MTLTQATATPAGQPLALLVDPAMVAAVAGLLTDPDGGAVPGSVVPAGGGDHSATLPQITALPARQPPTPSADPAEVAAVLAFLADPDRGAATASALPVDGDQSATRPLTTAMPARQPLARLLNPAEVAAVAGLLTNPIGAAVTSSVISANRNHSAALPQTTATPARQPPTPCADPAEVVAIPTHLTHPDSGAVTTSVIPANRDHPATLPQTTATPARQPPTPSADPAEIAAIPTHLTHPDGDAATDSVKPANGRPAQ